LWLVSRLSNVNEFVVQTPTMKKLMVMKVGEKIPIRVLPFVENPINFKRKVTKKNKSKNIVYDFIYVASGEAHKNHRVLIEAWILLAQEAIYPTLCLTLNKVNFFDLCKYIDDMRNQYDLKISNLGECSHCDILEFYEKSNAAIYPSIFESFGLPLIEARQAGLAVLAPELDYVRDIIDPDQVFDPSSSASIARAVRRFIGAEEPPLALLGASQFLASVFQKDIL
jgi:glycosyltransferase involved in cell wall biosynthesis